MKTRNHRIVLRFIAIGATAFACSLTAIYAAESAQTVLDTPGLVAFWTFGEEAGQARVSTATIPAMTFAGDAHYHYLTEDIIQSGLMKYENGCIKVPAVPGLGVKLDEETMQKYERYYEENRDYYARFHQDPYRPDWFPMVGNI